MKLCYEINVSYHSYIYHLQAISTFFDMKLPKVNVHVPPFRNGICRYTLRIPWVAVRISFTDQKTDLWAKRCWCQSSFINTFCLRYKAKDEDCYIIKLSIEWDKIVFMDVFKFWTSRFKFSNRILFSVFIRLTWGAGRIGNTELLKPETHVEGLQNTKILPTIQVLRWSYIRTEKSSLLLL